MILSLQDGVEVTEGVVNNSSGSKSSLYVQYAKENHAGTYRCQFENSAESVSRSISVSVLDNDLNIIIAGIIGVVVFAVILSVVLGIRIYKDKVCFRFK